MPHVILVSYTFVSSNPSTTEIYTLSYTTLFRSHLGLYPGIVANDGGSPNLQQTATAVGTNTALATTGLDVRQVRSEEHTSELQSHVNLVCRLLLEKKNHTSS